MDFVGPKYLASKERYYFLNVIDCDSHWAQVDVVEQRTARVICAALLSFWKAVGVPDFLQMDNELAFWGSLRAPNAVGEVIRLSLSLQVTPVFIPQSEPCRNGVIEHFNRKAQVVLAEPHATVEALRAASDRFEELHNLTHRYSSQQGQTPGDMARACGYPLKALGDLHGVAPRPHDLDNGVIEVIRFIRSDGAFHLFGLSYRLPETAVHEYVVGKIPVAQRQISFFLGQQHLANHPFAIC
jgi:hypothetical protein